MVVRSFYKNILFTLMPFWFAFFNGYSGQTLHDAWLITVYNMIFTCAPPFVIGIFEKDMDEDQIAKHPSAYVYIQVRLCSRNVALVRCTTGHVACVCAS